MRLIPWALFAAVFLSASFVSAQCVNDHRSNKNAGILITDFTITGTETISATDLAAITGDLIGSCFDEDSEEMGERVRASFQDRGYFKVEVKSLNFKPRDPLGVPKSLCHLPDYVERMPLDRRKARGSCRCALRRLT
jgi:hypothetical protein